MSCRNCDCASCEESRTEDRIRYGYYDEEEECANARDFDPPPAPPYSRTEEEYRVAMHSIFDQYPNAKIHRPAMIAFICDRINIKPHEWHEAQDKIATYLQCQINSGALSLTKGKNGGLFRNLPKIEVKKTIAGPVYSVGASPLQSANTKPAINDHTCLGCGNTSCSKSEKSCWKCGHPIA